MARPLLGVDDYVCDFKLLMRARLLFGIYNRLTAPTWMQMLAKLYCLFNFAFTLVLFHLQLQKELNKVNMFIVSRHLQWGVNVLWSLLTEDKYIEKFCSRVNLLDVTIDSAKVFSSVQCKIKYVTVVSFALKCAYFTSAHVIGWQLLAGALLEISITLFFVSKFLVLSLISGRLHILRDKLERCGFRNARHCRLGYNIYCEMYGRIIRSLYDELPIKFTMAVDFVCSSISAIIFASGIVADPGFIRYIFGVFAILATGLPLFAYCFELETAASHVETMREFTVTELIKNPSERERRAMRELLALTAAAPAQVALCRALHVDARLALALLSFCTARVVLLLQIDHH